MNDSNFNKLVSTLRAAHNRGHFDWDVWVETAECGTTACVAGWAAIIDSGRVDATAAFKHVGNLCRGQADEWSPCGWNGFFSEFLDISCIESQFIIDPYFLEYGAAHPKITNLLGLGYKEDCIFYVKSDQYDEAMRRLYLVRKANQRRST